MTSILICGDSFAADWTVKYPGSGWVNELAEEYNVTNLAQAGCSEYRIYKQLLSTSVENYDNIIISHTSPNRIFVEHHPVHSNDVLHKHSDLIYTDLVEHSKLNTKLSNIVDFFENYFSLEYAEFTHGLICEKIDNLLSTYKGNVVHICHIPWDRFYTFKDMLDFTETFKFNSGKINHYTALGNKLVYAAVKNRIKGE